MGRGKPPRSTPWSDETHTHAPPPDFHRALLPHPALFLLALIGAAVLALAGCTATPPLTGEAHPELPLTHVHGIVEDPASDGFLLGTHEGIFTVTPT